MGVLPTAVKSWNISQVSAASGTALAQDFQETMYEVHQAFLNAGWTINRISDSSSVATDGSDLWTDYTKIVWSATNRSWVVWQRPSASGSSMQVCIDCNVATGSGRLVSAFWSPSGAFAGGAINARPTATDEGPLGTYDGLNVPWAGQYTASFSSTVIGWYDDDDESLRIAIWGDTGGGAITALWLFDIIPASHNFSDDWDNEVVSIRGGSTGASILQAANFSNTGGTAPYGFFSASNVDYQAILGAPAYGGASGTSNFTALQAAADINRFDTGVVYPLLPITVVNHTDGGILGQLVDMYWGNDAVTAGLGGTATYPASMTARDWVHDDEVVLPWTGDSTVPWDMTASNVIDGYRTEPSYVTSPAAVEVLGVTPTDGTQIDPDEVVQFDVRSLAAIVRVVATVTFDGYTFREVAFDGDPSVATPTAGYEEAYAGSTVDTITDGAYYRYRFVMRRTPLWPASPELTVIAFNADGEEA